MRDVYYMTSAWSMRDAVDLAGNWGYRPYAGLLLEYQAQLLEKHLKGASRADPSE